MERAYFLNRRWTKHLIVLGAYLLLALVSSYPLVLQFGNIIPGVQGDVWSYLWAMGWARVSALNLGVNPFRDDYVFYPLGGATQLMWASALPSFASIPLQLAFGLVPAFNLVYCGSTVLTAYGTFLLSRYVILSTGRIKAGQWLGPVAASASKDSLPDPHLVSPSRLNHTVTTPTYVDLASFVGGAAFAFCALRSGYGLAFTNLYHTELIPFFVLFVLKTRFEGGWRNPIIAGLLLGLNVYIDFQIAAFLVLFSVLVSVTSLAMRSAFFATLPRFSTIALVSLLVASPMFAIVAQDLHTEGSNYIRVYPLKYSSARSYDLLSYFLPNARSSLFASLPAPQIAGVNAALNVDGESQRSPDRQAFLGLTVILLAIVGSIKQPRTMAIWIASAVVFALLSFGPTLHFAGSDLGIIFPYSAVHEFPILNSIRIPMRFGLLTFLSVAILAASGVNVLSAYIRPLPLTAIMTALILAESAVLPYPTLTVTVPEVYKTIAAQPGDFTVLEIPTFNWRAAAASEAFQVVHQKRILRVYTNRIAPDLADYFSLRQTPVVVRTLRILEGAEPGPITDDELKTDRQLAPAVIDFFSLRFAVIHREWLDSDTAARIDIYLREVMGARVIANDNNVVAYEFDPPSFSGSDLVLGLESDRALMYLGRGWQTEPLAQVDGEKGRYVAGSASELYFNGTTCQCPSPLLSLRAFSENGAGVLQFVVKGQDVGTIELKRGWANYDLSLPPGSIPGGMESIQVLHSQTGNNHIAIGRIELH